jgi:methionine-rich copper-binding protein CopC
MKTWRLLFVSLYAIATPVWAHTTLDHSEPKDGAVLSQAPPEIRMWFTEPIKAKLSTVEVRDAAGKQVDQRDLSADEKDPAVVRLSLISEMPPGIYRVTWSAVAQDLHVSKGSFSFRVGP